MKSRLDGLRAILHARNTTDASKEQQHMHSHLFIRCGLAAAVAIALLLDWGCSPASSPRLPTADITSALTPQLFSQRPLPTRGSRSDGWLLPEVWHAKQLIDVAVQGTNNVRILNRKGREIGSLSAKLGNPTGLCLDANNDLYVTNANGGAIVVFPSRSARPKRTLKDSLGIPVDCSVQGDGTLYVMNEVTIGSSSTGPGGVAVYRPRHRTPSRYITIPNCGNCIALALDSANDLYVSYNDLSGVGHVGFIKAHTSQVVDTGITLGFAGGIKVDSAGDIVVVDQKAAVIGIYEPVSYTLLRTITEQNDPYGIAFNSQGSRLFVSDVGNVTVDKFDYATGAELASWTLAGAPNEYPLGVAVIPGPPL
jgi:DNA-binding beta-propeller fold protein YncE